MFWERLLDSFKDELEKISEVNLSGLKAETIQSYPQPEPMPSAAYEKAQAILQKMGPTPIKTAAARSPRPDVLPELHRLLKKHKKEEEPPDTKLDKSLNWGGHVLGGTGAAKFIGDAAETGLAAHNFNRIAKNKAPLKFMMNRYYEGKFAPPVKRGILAAGAALGLAHKIRKERRKKLFKEGRLS